MRRVWSRPIHPLIHRVFRPILPFMLVVFSAITAVIIPRPKAVLAAVTQTAPPPATTNRPPPAPSDFAVLNPGAGDFVLLAFSLIGLGVLYCLALWFLKRRVSARIASALDAPPLRAE